MIHRPPVTDWETDFDHTHPDYAANAPEIWAELRAGCPVAHSQRFGGVWLPTRHQDVSAIAKDTTNFSSRDVVVKDWKRQTPAPIGYAPPITSDPPFHGVARELLLPLFAPKAVERWEPTVRQVCGELIDRIAVKPAEHELDAALEYAQHIPVMVMADMLGLPREDGEIFRDFIQRALAEPGMQEITPENSIDAYLWPFVQQRRAHPEDDVISYLCTLELDGQKLEDAHVIGTIGLLIIAGIDTTWSSIGASLWHMAQNPDDRKRWLTEPDIRIFAVEEFLRFYSPVTMARVVTQPVQVGDVQMLPEDWTLLSFPAANRDPEVFERADEFIIDRQRNRHAAFGLGIHRCIGSNLARLELRVALEEWMAAFPQFRLNGKTEVVWETGQVRGPRNLPITIGS